MKKKLAGLVIFCTLAGLVLTGAAQPPGERDTGPKKGPPRPFGFGNFQAPPFHLGKLLPPHVHDELELTDEQERQIFDVELEVKAKVMKILTEEQRKLLKGMRAHHAPPPPPPPGPPGPPPKRKGPPPRGEEGAEQNHRARVAW